MGGERGREGTRLLSLTQGRSHPKNHALRQEPNGPAPLWHDGAFVRPELLGFFNPQMTTLPEGHLIEEARSQGPRADDAGS